ncbi:MAG TPA: cytochrome c biogenesis heme-transporting ATPase CcmA [Woeseiaceae bacterium]|nr:cytochrome c biogenesis heme-transporting ATPase CcmA [Woeseiaceae bacterium]
MIRQAGLESVPAELRGHGLTLIRGDRALFCDLDFRVAAGELLLIEGANGSGKTSLLRVIAGLVQPQKGSVAWRRFDATRHRQAYHDELVWMGHRPGFKGDLTMTENLRVEAGLRRTRRATTSTVLERLGLGSVSGLPFRVLSAGQQRRVALARMLLADATLWLMDEPFTNLDVSGQALVTELLRGHLNDGGMGVVATHHELTIGAPVQRIRLT